VRRGSRGEKRVVKKEWSRREKKLREEGREWKGEGGGRREEGGGGGTVLRMARRLSPKSLERSMGAKLSLAIRPSF